MKRIWLGEIILGAQVNKEAYLRGGVFGAGERTSPKIKEGRLKSAWTDMNAGKYSSIEYIVNLVSWTNVNHWGNAIDMSLSYLIKHTVVLLANHSTSAYDKGSNYESLINKCYKELINQK